MHRRILIAATVLGAAVSAPASAQSPEDVRCLLLSNAFARGASDAQAKTAAHSAALFYLGKTDGRRSDAQLRTLFSQQKKTITAANAGAGMQICMQKMRASVKKLENLAR